MKHCVDTQHGKPSQGSLGALTRLNLINQTDPLSWRRVRKMSGLLPMLVGLKLDKRPSSPLSGHTTQHAHEQRAGLTRSASLGNFHGGMAPNGCMWVLHRALVAAVNYPLPSRQEPWCHAMELVLRAPDMDISNG